MTSMVSAFNKWWPKHEVGNGNDTPHADVWATLRSIKNAQRFREAADRMFMRLYSDLRYVGFETYRSHYDVSDVFEGLLSQNVIKSVIQTAQAKLDKIKIRPKPITMGGNHQLQWNALQLDKYLRGMIDEHRADELFSDARLQAMCLGTGGIKVYNDGEKVCAETTLSSEWWVDASEGRYRNPRTFYQERAIDKESLMAIYPEFAAQIESERANSVDMLPFFWTGADPSSDMLTVVEAWHLPSKVYADDTDADGNPHPCDGRHVICLPNVTLVNREWKRPRPPVAWMRWSLRARGFWGCGLVEDLVSAQLEYNATLQARQEAMRTMSAPFFAIEKGSKIVKSHLSDEIGRIVEYVGTPPQMFFPKGVDPSTFQHGDAVRRGMFEDSGISQLAASMQKPAGLNSGKAIRTYVDLESERIITALHSSEQMVLDYSELVLDESEDLAEQNPKLAVTHVGSDRMEIVEWSKARMDRDKFRLKNEPISVLSTTFAGRLQDVYELRDLGLVTEASEMRQLLGIPDLDQSNKRSLSMRNRLLQVIETDILQEGQYRQPDPLWDLDLALVLALESLADAEFEKFPGEKLDLLRQFIAEVSLMVGAANGAGGGAMPETAPTAPALPFDPAAASALPPMAPAGVPPGMADPGMPAGNGMVA